MRQYVRKPLCFGCGLCQNETRTFPRLPVISRIPIPILNIGDLDWCRVVSVYIETKKKKKKRNHGDEELVEQGVAKADNLCQISAERVWFRLRYPVITSRINNIDWYVRLQQKCLLT